MDLKYLHVACKGGRQRWTKLENLTVSYYGRVVERPLVTKHSEGAFGVCYTVQFYSKDWTTRYTFVLKVCKRGRVLAESKLPRNLGHRYIVPIKRFNQRVVAMPYYPLVLDALIADNAVDRHVTDVHSFTEKLGSALDYLRRRRMWYLDLKPANVAVSPDGDPVLLDVGSVVADRDGFLSATFPPPQYFNGIIPTKDICAKFVKEWQHIQLRILWFPYLYYQETQKRYARELSRLHDEPRLCGLKDKIERFKASFIVPVPSIDHVAS